MLLEIYAPGRDSFRVGVACIVLSPAEGPSLVTDKNKSGFEHPVYWLGELLLSSPPPLLPHRKGGRDDFKKHNKQQIKLCNGWRGILGGTGRVSGEWREVNRTEENSVF